MDISIRHPPTAADRDKAFQAAIANAPITVVRKDAMNNYVANTYIGPNATFNRQVWNYYGQDRTTNICEGYHHLINEKFGGGRPDPFKLITFLQDQEGMIKRRVGQLQLGDPPKKRKPAYILVDEALDRLRQQYFGLRIPNVQGLLQYMDAVRHQMYDVKH